MSRAVAALALLGTSLVPASGATAQTKEVFTPLVIVVPTRQGCFASVIPVTGFLVARREAIVVLMPGDEIVDVLVGEGETVAVDQSLAQVKRPAREPPRPGTEPRMETVFLKAPAAGTVIGSSASVGSTSSPARPEPLFRIAIGGEVELEAEVPSIHVPKLSAGQGARVVIEETLELPGRVRQAPPSIDPRTQLGRARISLGADPQLRFATFARAGINARQSCGLSVPRAAVTYRTKGTSVQVVVNNVINTRNVQIGLNSDTEVEITSGLSEGDLVVANAGTSLSDGDSVKPIEAASSLSGPR